MQEQREREEAQTREQREREEAQSRERREHEERQFRLRSLNRLAKIRGEGFSYTLIDGNIAKVSASGLPWKSPPIPKPPLSSAAGSTDVAGASSATPPPRPNRPAPRLQATLGHAGEDRYEPPCVYHNGSSLPSDLLTIQKIKVVLDWHGVLDSERIRDALGQPVPYVLQQFRNILRNWDHQVLFVICSFASSGWRVAEVTREARDLTSSMQRAGIPFCGYIIRKTRTGERGKAAFLAQIAAHCIVDDSGEIINECRRTGVWTYKEPDGAQARFLYGLEDFSARPQAEYVLRHHQARLLGPGEFSRSGR